jgi:hypothetical protein
VPARSRPIGPFLGAVPARPEKSVIGPGLGRQSGTTPDTARHEESIGPHSVGPNSAGPFRARAGLGPGGPFGILYPPVIVYSYRRRPERACVPRPAARADVRVSPPPFLIYIVIGPRPAPPRPPASPAGRHERNEAEVAAPAGGRGEFWHGFGDRGAPCSLRTAAYGGSCSCMRAGRRAAIHHNSQHSIGLRARRASILDHERDEACMSRT